MAFGFRLLGFRLLLALILVVPLGLPAPGSGAGSAVPDHLVVSEIVVGGASASDEMIEIHNPTPGPLPLEGLELVYASASGLTVSRRASWDPGAPEVPAGGHVLVAHRDGLFAAIADVTYAAGMATAGGSVALRVQGASTPIDGVGWGTASGLGLEGAPTPAPADGSSLERLPGGPAGSTQDTDDNASDFVERPVPDPQNLGSPSTPEPGTPTPTPMATPTSMATPTPMATPVATPAETPAATPIETPLASAPPTETPWPSPAATPTSAPSTMPTGTPTAAPTGTPMAEPTASPTTTPTATPATPDPAPIVGIGLARAMADGTTVTIEGTALTDSGFHDGGGFVADGTGAVAVLVDGATFLRGERIRVTGVMGDRFSQRTLRASGAQLVVLGAGSQPASLAVATGQVGEGNEGWLVRVHGTIIGSGTSLASGRAFDLDDGTGAVRLVVGHGTGIDSAGWGSGTRIEVVGVAGQRDSSGSGTEGYRVMPRDVADVAVVAPLASGSPAASAPASAAASASPVPSGMDEHSPDVVTIAVARGHARNARLTVAGVVTLGTGIIDPTTAVVEDGTGAIVLRLATDAGALWTGERVEVTGTRSTLRGMETLRVTELPRRLGSAPLPVPLQVRTGHAGEAHEGRRVQVRGAVVANARRAPGGGAWFDLDDGSGPLRVFLSASLAAVGTNLPAGAWVEVRGVLGQQTTGAAPHSGYRIWPAETSDVRVGALPASGEPSPGQEGSGGSDSPSGSPHEVGDGAEGVRIGATLVLGPWPELGVGGLLWDGRLLVGIAPASAGMVESLLAGGSLPMALDLAGLRVVGREPVTGIDLVALGSGPGDVGRSLAPPHDPATRLDGGPAWISVVGVVAGTPDALTLVVPGARLRLDRRCESEDYRPRGVAVVNGIGLAGRAGVVVACGGIRPAPVLARGEAQELANGIAPTPGAAEPDGSSPAVDTGRVHLVAGGLIGVALMLAATAAILRLRRRQRPEAAAAGHRGSSAAPADELDRALDIDLDLDPSAEPPRLVLVNAPRERGP